jgi:hypothetical protein
MSSRLNIQSKELDVRLLTMGTLIYVTITIRKRGENDLVRISNWRLVIVICLNGCHLKAAGHIL